LKVQCW